jgi:hypothetical protein
MQYCGQYTEKGATQEKQDWEVLLTYGNEYLDILFVLKHLYLIFRNNV